MRHMVAQAVKFGFAGVVAIAKMAMVILPTQRVVARIEVILVDSVLCEMPIAFVCFCGQFGLVHELPKRNGEQPAGKRCVKQEVYSALSQLKAGYVVHKTKADTEVVRRCKTGL